MEDLDNLLAQLESATRELNQCKVEPVDPTEDSDDKPNIEEYDKQSHDPQGVQRITVKKTVTTKTTYKTSGDGVGDAPLDQQQQPPQLQQNPHNLSELDNLLDDLSTAQENARVKSAPNGIPPQASVPPARPNVDVLLEDLDNAVTDERSSSYHQESYRTDTHAHEHSSYSTHQQEVPSASNATRELDDLMASLSDFKVQQKEEPSYAKPQKKPKPQQVPQAQPSPTPEKPPNELDSMLGSLQGEMSRQGIKTTAKGHCAECGKPIVGQMVTALGRTWHPEHFMCAHCGIELGTQNFFERDSKPFCEHDYHQLFSPKCAYCGHPILDKCVTALDKTWHPEHFFCAQCGGPFGEEGFHEKEGRAYCRQDYFEMFAPKCGACNRPIMENYISALSAQWHPECFVCMECHMPFNGGSFFDHEGMPYCETHYHAKRGSLCAGCGKPVTGRCITAMYRKFHPEHFVCAFCLKQLNKGTFKEQNDKPYCHQCFAKLFG